MVGFGHGGYLLRTYQLISEFFGLFVAVKIYSAPPFAEPPVEKGDLLRQEVHLQYCKDFVLTDSACQKPQTGKFLHKVRHEEY
jgi:hypothetical protein